MTMMKEQDGSLRGDSDGKRLKGRDGNESIKRAPVCEVPF